MSQAKIVFCSRCRRRALLGGMVGLLPLALMRGRFAFADPVADQFDYLSTHGNSSCSIDFMKSIATMPPTARLQGSCCGPMDRARYESQIKGLARFSAIPEIPADPYDIPAGLAQMFLKYYEIDLTKKEQPAYDEAMANSDEKGPCCCRCWRWNVLGGLAKYLIREHSFSGSQVTEVWNLTNGCGGPA